jgi:hypothetical protein
MTLFDSRNEAILESAKKLRDAGIAQVSENNQSWLDSAFAECVNWSALVRGQEITGERIRERVSIKVGNPNSPNAWGGLVRQLVKRGYLEDTGKTYHPADPKSHASRKPVWKFAHPERTL